MNFLKNIILFLIVLSSTGCAMEYSKYFDKAETLMQEHPKDALALLDSIKQHPIKGKAANARFALLYSQALDKNYIDVTDDSLISIAEAWYTKKGSIREKYLSHYYKGVVNSNAKKYPEAITAFSRAQKYEKELGDNYLLGQLYNQMGYIYERHYDYTKSLDAFVRAYDFYEQAGKINHKNYMLMNIAGCYWNMAENTSDTIYGKSEYYYRKALAEGEKTEYNILVKLTSQYLFIQYMERDMYDKAAEILEKGCIYEDSENVVMMAALAKYHNYRGDETKAKNMMEQAWKYCKGVNDSAKIYQWEYSIYKISGNSESALNSLESSVKIQNRAVGLNLKQPVLKVQKQLLEKELEYSQFRIEANRKIIVLTLILIVLLACVAIYFVKEWIRKKNEKMAIYVNLLLEMQRTLELSQQRLLLKDSQLSSVYSRTYAIIREKLDLINNLSTLFYEKHGTPKEKEILVKEVERIIESFRNNEEDIEWMEQVINFTNNNLLEKVYNDYPSIKESEKKLLCYIYAGFSPKAISIFLNIPLETVYNRKSRLLAKTGLAKAKK